LTPKERLHFARSEGNAEMLRHLKAAGSWLDSADKAGQTVLHFAVVGGSALAGCQGDPHLAWAHRRRREGIHTRDSAAQRGCRGLLKLAELLVDGGVDMNAVGNAARRRGQSATRLCGQRRARGRSIVAQGRGGNESVGLFADGGRARSLPAYGERPAARAGVTGGGQGRRDEGVRARAGL
jgi:hypothetical protein